MNVASSFLVCLLLGSSLATLAAEPWILQGTVISVSDGDTIWLRAEQTNQRHKIRLSDIDAPETSHSRRQPGQPFSQASRRALNELALNRTATATCYEMDTRYQRPVCSVMVDGVNVGATLVRRGLAWANRASKRYVRDPQTYELEASAKAERRGLWADPNAVAPWVWRRSCWSTSELASEVCSVSVELEP